MLRDTGSTTTCISEKFSCGLGLSYKSERSLILADVTICLCKEVEVEIRSPYLVGIVSALVTDCPFADVILGETACMKTNPENERICVCKSLLCK